jgi:hypothetical protein
MNPNKLKERQVSIAASPLNNRAATYNAGRRHLPKNNMIDETIVDKEYSNFFEYEAELSGLKPSSELFSILEERKKEQDNNFKESESKEEFEEFFEEKIESNSSVILEEVDHLVEQSFDFIRCEFIKNDGERCKRQAPRNHKFCSKHRNLTLK